MCAAATRTDLAPSAFARRIRTRWPPRLARTIILTVWLFSPGSRGGIPNRRAGPLAGGAAAGCAG